MYCSQERRALSDVAFTNKVSLGGKHSCKTKASIKRGDSTIVLACIRTRSDGKNREEQIRKYGFFFSMLTCEPD